MARDLGNRRDGLLKTVILRFKGFNPSLVLFAEDRFFENRPKLFFRRTFCRWRSNDRDDHLFSHPCPEKNDAMLDNLVRVRSLRLAALGSKAKGRGFKSQQSNDL